MLKNITLVMIFLIIYGSLYPFDFQFQSISDEELNAFFNTWLSITHKGDIVANILIFIPLGFTGAYYFSDSVPRIKAFSIILLLSILLGFGLQVLQLYLPSREANLFDGVLNIIGTGLGLLAAKTINISINHKIKTFPLSLPLVLVFSWFFYRLLPFVPSLDWKEIKISLKPLLLHPQLSFVGFWHDMVAWAIVLFFIERIFSSVHSQRNMVLLILSCFILEILIVNNSISLSNILGAGAGYGIWLLLRKSGHPPISWFLISLLSIYFVIYSFVPFEWSDGNNSFSWIPFSGFLSDSMYHNTLAFIEKFFFYGSLVWLMLNLDFRTRHVGILLATFLLLLEIAQIFIGQHSAEITDPLLILVLVYFFSIIKREHATAFYGDSKSNSISQDISVALFVDSDNPSTQIPSSGLAITSKPFYIGRTSSTHGKQLPKGRSLLLADTAPYQLSRKHFQIDVKNGCLAVIDCNSTLGTIVNGVSIGRKHRGKWARLNLGENVVIAGRADQGIKFKIILAMVEKDISNTAEGYP